MRLGVAARRCGGRPSKLPASLLALASATNEGASVASAVPPLGETGRYWRCTRSPTAQCALSPAPVRPRNACPVHLLVRRAAHWRRVVQFASRCYFAFMDFGISEEKLARAMTILARPVTALAFADGFFSGRANEPPGSRSRRGHALLGGLVRAGLVRRKANGGPSHDLFVVATSAGASPPPTAHVTLPARPDLHAFGSVPVAGVEDDAQGNVRLHGVSLALRGKDEASELRVLDLGRLVGVDFCEAVLVPIVSRGETWHLAQNTDPRYTRTQVVIDEHGRADMMACDAAVTIPAPGIRVSPTQALRVLWLREQWRRAIESFCPSADDDDEIDD